MNWRDLPSLAALRAFEAAARHQSYSAAARELNVTHAAIAQHLRTLEDHFGLPLMHREGQSMAVTKEARDLATALTQGFEQIGNATRNLTQRDDQRPLRVSLTPSFAGGWLMPRIGGFWTAYPGIALDLSPGMGLVDLRRDGFDVAIRYGRGGWPGVTSQPLVSASHCVVAAPTIGSSKMGSLKALANEHWLLEKGRREEWVWAADNGLDLDRARVTLFDTSAMALQAVLAGHGVSIMPSAIVDRDIAAGRLVALCQNISSELAYHVLTRPDRVSPQARAFVKWLMDQTKSDRASPG